MEGFSSVLPSSSQARKSPLNRDRPRPASADLFSPGCFCFHRSAAVSQSQKKESRKDRPAI